MSLKVFHIIFISVSILLCFGFGLWLVLNTTGFELLSFVGAGISFAAGLGLVYYGKRFIRKFKHVSNL
jgi:hypothetical protein